MEIYDKAQALAKAIGECREYEQLVKAGEELAKDKSTKDMVKEFLVLQAELVYGQSMGAAPAKKRTDRLNELSVLIKNNTQAQDYLQTYHTWQNMAGEILQIIQQAMAKGMSILDR